MQKKRFSKCILHNLPFLNSERNDLASKTYMQTNKQKVKIANISRNLMMDKAVLCTEK